MSDEGFPPKEPKIVPPRDDQSLAAPALAVVITVFSLSVLFLIYRRASTWKTVVQHRMRTWTTREGPIRLPEDESDEGLPIHSTSTPSRPNISGEGNA
ncbi:hypothetical protein BDV93DRAFT_519909 [Ceratobasidium sp. AG-I]|nr:hypothetical protein BDV93DRAFT_519909 [Ceratobasidium sp. AG-I]